MILMAAALGMSIWVFHGVGAPYLNIAAAVGLVVCAARLAYFYVRYALVIPESWDDKDDKTQRPALLWPALLAVSGAGALVASASALIAGAAPAWGWTDAEVIGGSALMLLGGALVFWARWSDSKPASATSIQA